MGDVRLGMVLGNSFCTRPPRVFAHGSTHVFPPSYFAADFPWNHTYYTSVIFAKMANRLTLQQLKTGGNRKTEAKCVKATVVSLSPFPASGPMDAKARNRCSMVLADSSGTMRGFCYRTPTFQVGWTVKFRNFAVRDARLLYHTRTTAIRCATDEVNADTLVLAEQMRASPAACFKTILAVTTTPRDTRVSFKGAITELQNLREIKTSSGKVPLREITVQDATANIKVTLWSQTARQNLTAGQRVIVLDAMAVWSEYHSKIAIAVNYPDEFQANDAPQTNDALLEGIIRNDDGTFVATFAVDEQDCEMRVPEPLLLALLNLEDWDEGFAFAQLPLEVSISYNNDLVSMLHARHQADGEVGVEDLGDDM